MNLRFAHAKVIINYETKAKTPQYFAKRQQIVDFQNTNAIKKKLILLSAKLRLFSQITMDLCKKQPKVCEL